MRYKGKYRLRTPIDKTTNMFPREYNGQFADNDVYIDCANKITVSSYGRGILEVYIPSIGRGRNIIKAIKEEIGDNIILNIVETDEEIIFKFHAKHMEQLEKYLKPKTLGADISPFSSRNLRKSKYSIPDKDLNAYKDIVSKIPQNELISLVHTTNKFLEIYSKKNMKGVDVKADMALRGIKGKEYIHSIGAWDKYIEYLRKNI